jgi:hypothetical protein
MAVLLWGSVSVAAAFAFHVALWQIYLPKRQTRAVLLIFLAALAMVLAVLWFVPHQQASWVWPASLPEYLHISLFVVVFALAYTITYSAIEVDSPSLVMAIKIAEAGQKGMSQEEFHAYFSDKILVDPRLADMVRDGLAEKIGREYRITSKGRAFVATITFFRAILGAGKGG